MKQPANRPVRRLQTGVTMFGLVFWAMFFGFFGYVAVRVLPTVNEYLTVQRLVDKVAAAAPASVPEARNAFDKLKEIEFSVQSISGSDLEIAKEGEKVVIKYAYSKEIPLGGPASLLIRYNGRSR